MDVNELSADELRKLADEKTTTRTLDIDGLVVHVDTEKCKSWNAFKIMSSIGIELDVHTMQKMIDFIELVTDVDEQTIIEHCGGESASFESVVLTVSKIVSECYPKN